MSHYDVYLWFGDPEGWHRHRAGVRKWTLRRVLRKLRGRSYSAVSILVERNEG